MKLLRLPELIIEVIDNYDNEPRHKVTGLPTTLHQKLLEVCKDRSVNKKHRDLTVHESKLLLYQNQTWWIPLSCKEVILWIIWNYHTSSNMHIGINETIKNIQHQFTFEYIHY